MPSTAVVGILDGGFNPFRPTDPKYPLVANLDFMVLLKIISDAPVPLVRAFIVDFFRQFCDSFIFLLTYAFLSTCPLIIGGSGNPQLLTAYFNRISILCNTCSNSRIFMDKLYLRKAFLLSDSSNFFSKSRSCFVIYNSCSN